MDAHCSQLSFFTGDCTVDPAVIMPCSRRLVTLLLAAWLFVSCALSQNASAREFPEAFDSLILNYFVNAVQFSVPSFFAF